MLQAQTRGPYRNKLLSKKSSWFSTTNIIVVFLALNFITMAINMGFLIQYGQLSQTYDADVNATASALIQKSDRNYLAVVAAVDILSNNTNQTNTLLKFLTDSFGAESGYLETENFQYGQANQTFAMVKELLNSTK